MATTMLTPPSPRGEVPISEGPAPVRSRSRPLIAAGVLVTLLGALGGWALVRQAGDRTDVLAVAADVPVGTQLEESDLRVVALPDTPGLSPVPASELDSVVGQRAAVSLSAGSLLTSGQITAEPVLEDGEDLVALDLARGRGPVTMLDIGDSVQVVPVQEEGASSSSGEQDPVAGRVVDIGRPSESGDTVIHLAVAESDSTQVAAWAAGGDVALVLTDKH